MFAGVPPCTHCDTTGAKPASLPPIDITSRSTGKLVPNAFTRVSICCNCGNSLIGSHRSVRSPTSSPRLPAPHAVSPKAGTASPLRPVTCSIFEPPHATNASRMSKFGYFVLSARNAFGMAALSLR